MKSSFLILLFTVLLSSFAHAQPELAGRYPLAKGKFSKNAKIFFAECNEVNKVAISVLDGKYIRRLTLDSSKDGLQHNLTQISDDITLKDTSHEDAGFMIPGAFFSFYNDLVFIKGKRKENDLNEVFLNNNTNQVFLLETNFSTKETKITDTVNLIEEEKLLTCFSRENAIWIVSSITGENKLHFYIKKPDYPVLKKSIEIDLKDSVKNCYAGRPKKQLNFTDIVTGSELVVLEASKFNPYFKRVRRKKLYIYPNELIFTINSFNFYAYTIHINLDSYIWNLNQFDLTPTSKNNHQNELYTNAVLYGDYMTTVHKVQDKQLRLNVFDIQKKKLLKTQLINKDIIDDIAITPVIKVGNFESKDTLVEKKLNTLLSRVDNPAVEPVIYDSTLYVNIGGPYERFDEKALVLTAAAGLAGMGIANALNISQIYLPIIYTIDPLNTISFQAAFNTAQNEFVKAVPFRDGMLSLQNFTHETKDLFSRELFYFYLNSSAYFVSFTKDRKSLVIYKSN